MSTNLDQERIVLNTNIGMLLKKRNFKISVFSEDVHSEGVILTITTKFFCSYSFLGLKLNGI